MRMEDDQHTRKKKKRGGTAHHARDTQGRGRKPKNRHTSTTPARGSNDTRGDTRRGRSKRVASDRPRQPTSARGRNGAAAPGRVACPARPRVWTRKRAHRHWPPHHPPHRTQRYTTDPPGGHTAGNHVGRSQRRRQGRLPPPHPARTRATSWLAPPVVSSCATPASLLPPVVWSYYRRLVGGTRRGSKHGWAPLLPQKTQPKRSPVASGRAAPGASRSAARTSLTTAHGTTHVCRPHPPDISRISGCFHRRRPCTRGTPRGRPASGRHTPGACRGHSRGP